MRPLDEELRAALKRPEAPAGFTQRVMARIAAEPASRTSRRDYLRALFRMPGLRWAAIAIAAGLLLVIGAVQYEREQRARRQGEMAKEQLMQALHIASSKLNLARKKVQEIDRRSPQS
jgi:VIT1/CCC1 family predicted Fe2+/Mn2+ transporter